MAISFRVAEPEAKYLADLSDRLGVSQSEVLRLGIKALAAQHLGAASAPYDLGADLFGGEANVEDSDLAQNASKRLRKLVREKRSP